jgi:hypothetical protein
MDCQATALLMRPGESQVRDHPIGINAHGGFPLPHPDLTLLARAQTNETHPPKQKGQWPIDLPEFWPPPNIVFVLLAWMLWLQRVEVLKHVEEIVVEHRKTLLPPPFFPERGNVSEIY